MNNQHMLGYALLALMIFAGFAGIAWQWTAHRRKLHRWYGRRDS